MRRDHDSKLVNQYARAFLKILDLPLGSKEGKYELALLGSSGEEIRSATGAAQLENHTVVLNANIDLAGVSPGSYFLGLRQPGLGWSRYPARVK
jgi:hypothetical protein